MTTKTFPYSYPVNAAEVVDTDRKVVVTPDAVARGAIADAYDLVAISHMAVEFVLKPYRKAGLRVVGSVSMDMTRTCVVSLEPFESRLVFDVDRTFEPVSSRSGRIRDLNEEGEIEIDLETLDPPDVILDGTVDLGALVCEELALALDPFPRMPGVEFELRQKMDSAEADEADDADKKPSPFAVLQALKTDKDK